MHNHNKEATQHSYVAGETHMRKKKRNPHWDQL
jgi:hypothetical protein